MNPRTTTPSTRTAPARCAFPYPAPRRRPGWRPGRRPRTKPTPNRAAPGACAGPPSPCSPRSPLAGGPWRWRRSSAVTGRTGRACSPTPRWPGRPAPRHTPRRPTQPGPARPGGDGHRGRRRRRRGPRRRDRWRRHRRPRRRNRRRRGRCRRRGGAAGSPAARPTAAAPGRRPPRRLTARRRRSPGTPLPRPVLVQGRSCDRPPAPAIGVRRARCRRRGTRTVRADEKSWPAHRGKRRRARHPLTGRPE